ncbi:MAG TPA: N-formylglutamate amidohydrolase [Candidatus Binataceae bacterium]|jgi:predicted N-formylglutamate amidohydrolase|nr:N-formylglutamate amidohydrolase [Candidatus Binataceae bacterium]
MDDAPTRLLAADEPPPVTVSNEGGRSPLVIVVDHAGKYLPRRLQMLGLEEAQCEEHIAWDIGAGAVSCLLGDALDAVVIRQNYSRLAIDCNRTPGSETSIVEVSEFTAVPGNVGLSKAQIEARVREIFQPYHDRIAGELDRRRKAGRPTVLIAMHSFTPVFKAAARQWHVGLLYNRDPRLANMLMELLRHEQGLVVGDNEPYRLSDESDYTIPIHGERRVLPHVEIEIRQDLIADEAGQRRWAGLFAQLLPQAYQRLL